MRSRLSETGELLGYVDSVEPSPGLLRIAGWVADSRSNAESLEILVRSDDGAEILAVADLPRPDLVDFGVSNIMAGFDLSLPITRFALTVDIHVRGAEGWRPFKRLQLETLEWWPAPDLEDVRTVFRVLLSRLPTEEEGKSLVAACPRVENLVDHVLQSNEVLKVNGDWLRVLKALSERSPR